MGIELDEYSISELERELERRKVIERLNTFTPLSDPDFSDLIDIVKGHVRTLLRGEYEPDEHYIFEAAIEAIYGDIWKQWNEVFY